MDDALISSRGLSRRYNVGKTVVAALSDVELTVRAASSRRWWGLPAPANPPC